jgi:hypothetical protein
MSLCSCVAVLRCRCMAVSLCGCVAVSLCRYVAVSLCRCVVMSLLRCVAVLLCRYVAVSLCRCVAASLCRCVTVLLCRSVAVSLCQWSLGESNGRRAFRSSEASGPIIIQMSTLYLTLQTHSLVSFPSLFETTFFSSEQLLRHSGYCFPASAMIARLRLTVTL